VQRTILMGVLVILLLPDEEAGHVCPGHTRSGRRLRLERCLGEPWSRSHGANHWTMPHLSGDLSNAGVKDPEIHGIDSLQERW
jgi:hypothetical protein